MIVEKFKYVIAYKKGTVYVGLSPLLNMSSHLDILDKVGLNNEDVYSAGFVSEIPSSLFCSGGYITIGRSDTLEKESKSSDIELIRKCVGNIDTYYKTVTNKLDIKIKVHQIHIIEYETMGSK